MDKEIENEKGQVWDTAVKWYSNECNGKRGALAQVCRENILFPTQLISEQVHKLLRWAYDVQTLGLGEAEMHKKQNMPSRNLQSSRDPDKKKTTIHRRCDESRGSQKVIPILFSVTRLNLNKIFHSPHPRSHWNSQSSQSRLSQSIPYFLLLLGDFLRLRLSSKHHILNEC